MGTRIYRTQVTILYPIRGRKLTTPAGSGLKGSERYSGGSCLANPRIPSQYKLRKKLHERLHYRVCYSSHEAYEAYDDLHQEDWFLDLLAARRIRRQAMFPDLRAAFQVPWLCNGVTALTKA